MLSRTGGQVSFAFFCCRPHTRPRVSEKQKKPPLTTSLNLSECSLSCHENEGIFNIEIRCVFLHLKRISFYLRIAILSTVYMRAFDRCKTTPGPCVPGTPRASYSIEQRSSLLALPKLSTTAQAVPPSCLRLASRPAVCL